MNTGRLVTGQQTTDANRSRVLLTLIQRGPSSRSELARLSGVTRTTIGSYIDGLLHDGVVEELAPTGSGGKGRPARPVRLRRSAGVVASAVVDLGGIDVALVNARGDLIAHRHHEVERDIEPGPLAERVARAISDISDISDPQEIEHELRPVGVGVVVGTAVDFDRQTLQASARFPGVDGAHFLPHLKAALEPLPVVAENDARAGALAELWWGRGRDEGSFWSIQVGEGIGAAAIIDGRLLRGPRGVAGEIGHTTVGGTLRCGCGRVGCWETTASLTWLRSEADLRGLPDAPDLDPGTLAAAARHDPEAEALMIEMADHLAVGLSNLIHTVGPQSLVLQGEVVDGGETLRGLVEEAVRRRTLDHLREPIEVHLSALGARTRLLGGAATFLSTRWIADAV